MWWGMTRPLARRLGYTPRRRIGPSRLRGGDVSETQNGGLREGQRMGNFELPDEGGRPFELYRRLREGPVVLVFYRGDW